MPTKQYKSLDELRRIALFYSSIPPWMKMDEITFDWKNLQMSYSWMLGSQDFNQGSLTGFYSDMVNFVWNQGCPDQDDIIHGLFYLQSIGYPLVDDLSKNSALHATNQCLVHGDLTLENVLLDPDDLPMLLDPGIHRGFSFKEADEAKLLQSILVLWERVKRGFNYPLLKAPFQITELHLSLLDMHLFRAIRHSELHSSDVIDHLKFARQVLASRGPGWDPYQLQELCLSRLQDCSRGGC